VPLGLASDLPATCPHSREAAPLAASSGDPFMVEEGRNDCACPSPRDGRIRTRLVLNVKRNRQGREGGTRPRANATQESRPGPDERSLAPQMSTGRGPLELA
jgi:hypothetical protein